MRQLHILFNSAKTWHEIVCWFLCFAPNLPELSLKLFWTPEQTWHLEWNRFWSSIFIHLCSLLVWSWVLWLLHWKQLSSRHQWEILNEKKKNIFLEIINSCCMSIYLSLWKHRWMPNPKIKQTNNKDAWECYLRIDQNIYAKWQLEYSAWKILVWGNACLAHQIFW